MSSLRRGIFVLSAAVPLVVPRGAGAQSRFGVHVFGVSYHYASRTYQDASGAEHRYEQVNLGLGAEYRVRQSRRVLVTLDGGVYRDSKDRGNLFAGPALRLRAGSHLLLGGGLVAMTSATYGTPVAPLPLLSVRWPHLTANATWIPALSRRESGAVGLFSTIHL